MDDLRVYKDKAGEWRWTLSDGGNHEVIGASSEGYQNRAEALLNAARLLRGAEDFEVHFDQEADDGLA